MLLEYGMDQVHIKMVLHLGFYGFIYIYIYFLFADLFLLFLLYATLVFSFFAWLLYITVFV